MMRFLMLSLCLCHFSTTQAQTVDLSATQKQVMETEKAFAKTMAARDFVAFTTFISDEAVFFSSSKALHGKAEIATAWKAYYADPAAPFSWEPGQVEVLDSGKLALSTGPVHDADGKLIATFTSIWRQDAPGVWHIVFDKGNAACECGSMSDKH